LKESPTGGLAGFLIGLLDFHDDNLLLIWVLMEIILIRTIAWNKISAASNSTAYSNPKFHG
jgi:hypothetical protein